MTRRVKASAGQAPGDKQADSDLVTAQILAGFQYEDPSRSKSADCSADCHVQLPDSCLKECELPCTDDCTDDCVVVCEEPHNINEDLCCDFEDACDNRDCQYSYLDESCCYGCDPNAFSLLHGQPHNGLSVDGFDLSGLPLFQHQHNFSAHFGPHQHQFRQDILDSGNLGYRPICYSNVGMSHCAMACTSASNTNYDNSPIPSLIQSTADSPWSLQSSISGTSIQQYTPLPTTESDNPLNLLASYTTNDINLFTSSSAISNQAGIRFKNAAMGGLPTATGVDLLAPGSDLSQPSLGGISGDTGFSELSDFAKSTDNSSEAKATTLQCRWVVTDATGPKLCGCSFQTREDLHKHIIDDHVKSIKKRGSNVSVLNPICGWHGCESARKKKVFKLQHLKDHIVCHSKLRMKCEICGKECRDAKVLKLHMNTHRPGQEKPFRCDFEGCTASFGTSALLSSHKRVHTGEKPHKCAWCDYRAADKGNLRRHEEEMHMGKKWPCPYCSQKLAKKANLTRHIRDLHANEIQDPHVELA